MLNVLRPFHTCWLYKGLFHFCTKQYTFTSYGFAQIPIVTRVLQLLRVGRHCSSGSRNVCSILHSPNRASWYTYMRNTNKMHTFLNNLFHLIYRQHVSNKYRRKEGTAVAQWLRCCATNRKVAGSIPDGVIGIFHWHNPSDRTMAMGSTQPLTEMSTRSISWG